MQQSWNVAAGASAKGSLDCVTAWYTDFRKDLPKIDVPTLVIHGDADRIVPIAASGELTAKAVKGARKVVIQGGPHGHDLDPRRPGEQGAPGVSEVGRNERERPAETSSAGRAPRIRISAPRFGQSDLALTCTAQ